MLYARAAGSLSDRIQAAHSEAWQANRSPQASSKASPTARKPTEPPAHLHQIVVPETGAAGDHPSQAKSTTPSLAGPASHPQTDNSRPTEPQGDAFASTQEARSSDAASCILQPHSLQGPSGAPPKTGVPFTTPSTSTNTSDVQLHRLDGGAKHEAALVIGREPSPASWSRMDKSQQAASSAQPGSNGSAVPARPITSQMAGLVINKPIALPPTVRHDSQHE